MCANVSKHYDRVLMSTLVYKCIEARWNNEQNKMQKLSDRARLWLWGLYRAHGSHRPDCSLLRHCLFAHNAFRSCPSILIKLFYTFTNIKVSYQERLILSQPYYPFVLICNLHFTLFVHTFTYGHVCNEFTQPQRNVSVSEKSCHLYHQPH